MYDISVVKILKEPISKETKSQLESTGILVQNLKINRKTRFI